MRNPRDTSTKRGRTRGLVASFAAIVLGVTGMVAVAASASAAPSNVNNPNHPAYWEAQFSAHSAVCYKHNDSRTANDHGRIVKDSDNKWSGVKLNTFNQAWPGDHWEALIVNGGPDGDNVVQHPVAGTTYYTPGTNQQGKRYDVSHWIVCKGTTPAVQVAPVAPVFTPPTCDAPGTLVGTDTAQYAWTRSGPDSAAVLTATAIGNVTLTGQTAFGPHDLTQLSGEACFSETPEEIPVDPAVYTPPTCDAVGTLVGVDTADYTWTRSGPDTAAVLTAGAIGDVILTGQTVFGPYDLTQLTGESCLSETPEEVPVDPAVFTAPTCDAPGTLVGVDTAQYFWTRSGPDTAAVLTVAPIGNVTLTGQTVFGPHDLTPLAGEACLSDTPLIPETPIVPQAPVVPTVTQTALAETGLPLLGLLGMAGSFGLIGGGLLNARRLLARS